MTDLLHLKTPLEDVARLYEPLNEALALRTMIVSELELLRDNLSDVVSMRPELQSVVSLRTTVSDMTLQVASLQTQIDSLAGPGTPAARLVSTLDWWLNPPIFLGLVVLLGLAVWTGLTFAAVRFAIISASTATK